MIKGINKQYSGEGTPKGYATYAKNILISKKLDEIINEKGTELVQALENNNILDIIGIISFGSKIIFFYKSTIDSSTVLTERFVNPDITSPGNPWTQFETSIPSLPTYTIQNWIFSSNQAILNGVPSSNITSTLLHQTVNLQAGSTATFSTQYIASATINTSVYLQFFDASNNLLQSTSWFDITSSSPLSDTKTVTLTVPANTAKVGLMTQGIISLVNSLTIERFSVLGVDTVAGGESSCIGVYDEDDNTFTVKLARTDLNFLPEYPITGKAKLNLSGQLIVAFTDNFNTPKYINLDNASSTDSLSLYGLFPFSRNPNIELTPVEGSGAYKTGAYLVAIRYIDENKSGTSWSQLSDPLYIVPNSANDDYRIVEGNEGGITTNKGIRVRLTNLDTSYKKLQIGIISKIKDVVTFGTLKEISFNTADVNTVITGSELVNVLDISEVLTKNPVFDRVAEIESLNDQLFLADFRTTPVTDLQRLANRLTVTWKSDRTINGAEGADEATDGNIKTFIHDEIYGLYVQFELPNGSWSNWFHVPGRALSAGHRDPSTLANSINLNGVTPRKYQLEDTCTTTLATPNTGEGLMGVWENEDEIYPVNFPDFAGQKVRHHRFPSVSYMNAHYGGQGVTQYGSAYWDILTFKTQLTDIPADLVGKFTGYRMGYAKREEGNITVLGYDIIQNAGRIYDDAPGFEIGTTPITTTLFSGIGGNWENRIKSDEFTVTVGTPSKQILRLHSPDLLFYKFTLQNLYLANIKKMRTVTTNDFVVGGSVDFGELIYTNVDNFGNTKESISQTKSSHISNFRDNTQLGTVSNADKYKALSDSKYVPHGAEISDSNGTIFNIYSEEVISTKVESDLDIQNSGVEAGDPYYFVNKEDHLEDTSPNLFEETYLTAIKTLRTNIFVAYTDQVVIGINNIVRDYSTPTQHKGGDGFVCLHSFVVAGFPFKTMDDVSWNTEIAQSGWRNIKVFLCESRINLNQRYTEQGNLSTYFYPFLGSKYLTNQEDYWLWKISLFDTDLNHWLYNKDNSTINDFEQFGVFDSTVTEVNDLPFAIARSQKASRDSDIDDGWRVFKSNDIFYTVRDRGYIKNLTAFGTDALLIHHERGLFKTRDKAVLQTDITAISLGSGDLFELEPQETTPTEYGHGGTQHKFSCMLTEAGYFFVDAATGEVFLYKGGDSFEFVTKGLRDFFYEYLKRKIYNDNPINDEGFTVGFDKENLRILLSLKADLPFTVSYDMIKSEWASFHSYIPDLFVTTRKNIYSIKEVSLWKHNKGAAGTFYSTIYPSYVDIVFNDEPLREKVLASIEWVTRVFKNGINKPDETLTHITVWNDYFCSGKIEVKPQTLIAEYDNKNAKQADRSWRYDDVTDKVINPELPFIDGISNDYNTITSNINLNLAWFEEQEMRGKYFNIRLEYSNFEDKTVSLRGFIANTKRSDK